MLFRSDVFTDVFGKAASAITTRLLESNEPFDVTPYLTKGIKTPVEKIQAAACPVRLVRYSDQAVS